MKDENQDDEDFLNLVGTSLDNKTLLINALKMCEDNDVMTGEDITVIEIHKACPNLKLKRINLSDMSKAQLFCEICGMICPIMIPDHESVFGPAKSYEESSEELDEFLGKAGTHVISSEPENDEELFYHGPDDKIIEDPLED